MSGYRVTSTGLVQAGERCDAVADEARGGLAVLARAADDLFGAGGWTGTAAHASAAGWEQWHAGAVRMIEALDLMADALRRAAHDYDTAEAGATLVPAAVGL